MTQLERYFEQMEELLLKIIQDGYISVYRDSNISMSLHHAEEDTKKIKDILEQKKGKTELEDFYYLKPRPIILVESDENSSDTYSEEGSLVKLAEYLKRNQDFQVNYIPKDKLSIYTLERFRGITHNITDKLCKGLQVPYLRLENKNVLKQITIGYLSYNLKKDYFIIQMNSGDIRDIDIYKAMHLVFYYMFQRSELSTLMAIGKRPITGIPIGYKEQITYIDPEDNTEKSSKSTKLVE